MRDLIIFAVIFAMIPMVLKRPAFGVVVFAWISIMNPHRLTYGSAKDFQFAAIIAVATMAAMLFSKEPRRYPWTPVTILILVFATWMTLTTLFALSPTLAWLEWNRVIKTFLMIAITILVITEKKDLMRLVWVLGLSLGFFGLKGGIFTIVSGGSYRVWGPDGSYISENNSLAVAFVMTVPILWYLRNQTKSKLIRHGLEFVALMTIVSAAGSYSRGAILAGVAMLGMLWLKSKRKLTTSVVLALVVPLVLMLMPDQWLERMASISEYKSDGSSMGRINAWYFAFEIAKRFVMGGGFNVFNPAIFRQYAPDPTDFHVAHSIYFQVLGEHGFVGITIYVLLILTTWRLASKTIRTCNDQAELRWAGDLAKACQVSLTGYLVGGAFLSLAYYDYFYYILATLVIIGKVIAPKRVENSPKVTRPVMQQVRKESLKRINNSDRVV